VYDLLTAHAVHASHRVHKEYVVRTFHGGHAHDEGAGDDRERLQAGPTHGVVGGVPKIRIRITRISIRITGTSTRITRTRVTINGTGKGVTHEMKTIGKKECSAIVTFGRNGVSGTLQKQYNVNNIPFLAQTRSYFEM
jgi:hypothetical protein